MRDRIINGISMLLGNGKIYDTSNYQENLRFYTQNKQNNILLEQQNNPIYELFNNYYDSLNKIPDIQNVSENLCKTAYSSLGQNNVFAPYCCDKYKICK